MSKWHYVYIIATVRDGEMTSPVKVGITGSVNSRIKQIQTGSAEKVCYAAVFTMPDRSIARGMELAFHTVLSERNKRGEWFDIEPFEAIQLMCLNIEVHLRKMLPGWTEEKRAKAFSATGATAALALIERGAARLQ